MDAARLGDVASRLRSDRQFTEFDKPQAAIEVKRQVLADFCRLVGARLNAASPAEPDSSPAKSNGDGDGVAPVHSQASHVSSDANHNGTARPNLPHLSRRMRQTLRQLLAGSSEKEIAAALRLSQNTIHVYVKALYRGFGVNSRAELMARFVAVGGSLAALDDAPAVHRATG